MPEFTYRALDASGRERRGSLHSSDTRSAALSLRGEGLAVLSLDARSSGSETGIRSRGPRAASFLRRRPSSRDREAFLRQLSVLLGSGLTLLQALDTSSAGSAPPAVRRIALRLADEVRAGKSFSAALTPHRDWLGESALERVAASELSGELDAALETISIELERSRRVRTQLKSALSYPAVVLLVAIGVAALLVLQVVPRFALFFSHSGKPMPSSLVWLVDASELVASVGPLVIAALMIGLLTILAVRRRPAGRLWVDRALLGLPGLGWLFSRHALLRATHSLGSLLQAGIPVLNGLRLAGSGAGNAAIGDVFAHAAERVLSGSDVAQALEHPLVPFELRQVVAVGERSGELSRVLLHLAADYERQVEGAIARLTAASEPVLLLFVGGLVGSIYVAFFQAIFQVAGG